MLLRHTGVTMAQLGQFAVVSSLTGILVGSGHAFFLAALPVLSRSKPRTGTGVAFGRLTALATGAVGAAAVAMGWLLGPPLTEWVLGPRYAVAGAILAPFLSIGGLLLLPTGYEQALAVAGRRWPIALAYFAAGVCLAAFFPPAVAQWGLDGALLATASAWFIRAVVLIAVGEMDALCRRRAPLSRDASRVVGEPEGGL
jgi:O-antigen/teichoic acid export membrane protein